MCLRSVVIATLVATLAWLPMLGHAQAAGNYETLGLMGTPPPATVQAALDQMAKEPAKKVKIPAEGSYIGVKHFYFGISPWASSGFMLTDEGLTNGRALADIWNVSSEPPRHSAFINLFESRF